VTTSEGRRTRVQEHTQSDSAHLHMCQHLPGSYRESGTRGAQKASDHRVRVHVTPLFEPGGALNRAEQNTLKADVATLAGAVPALQL
jgi:hypothetical protein